jgi:hypothetical protein
MPVVRRDDPAASPNPASKASLEDILRDAACFAAHDEVPTGLAHRALAREIAKQSGQERRSLDRRNPRRTFAIWLGGLSAGTVAGASAAVLILAHLNSSGFQLTPTPTVDSEAAETSASISLASSSSVEIPTAVREHPLPPPRMMTVTPAAMASVKLPEVKPRFAAKAHAEPKVRLPLKPMRVARGKDTLSTRTALSPKEMRHASSSSKEADAPPVTHWKTEPFEETEYQLVTTAYVPSPGSGSYPVRNDHIQLTPVRMRASFETAGVEPAMGPSVAQN